MTVSKRATYTEWIDPDDAPELTDDFFQQADEYVGDKLVRRGRPLGSHKTATTSCSTTTCSKPSRRRAGVGRRA